MSRYIDADKILYTDLSEGRGVCWVTFSDWIKEMPTADVRENVKGRWTDDNACPFCGFQPYYERDIHTLSFCPNCGADMRSKS